MKIKLGILMVGVGCVLLLVGCQKKLNTKPKINPQTRSHLIVDGYIAPSLRHTIKLKWGITYITHNPQCPMQVKSLGINMPIPYRVTYHPKISSSGHFKLTIPLDLLVPGKCQWRFYALYYPILVFDRHGKQVREILSTVNGFDINDDHSKQDTHFKQVWFCNNKNCQVKVWQGLDLLTPNQNYYLKLTFRRRTTWSHLSNMQ